MEIKFLVYLVAGIVWFIFNNKNKIKKDSPTIDDSLRPVLAQTSSAQLQNIDKQASANRIPINSTKKVIQGGMNRNSKGQPPQEGTKNKIFIAPETEKSDATAAFKIIEIDSNTDYEQYSIGNRIGMDIRNGNLDLRKAVVINELLRPVYF